MSIWIGTGTQPADIFRWGQNGCNLKMFFKISDGGKLPGCTPAVAGLIWRNGFEISNDFLIALIRE